MLAVLAALMAFTAVMPALAVEPDEILADPALEARARHISAGLRCLVCQNQSIDDSNAPLARDLRLLVRERLKEGDSDDEVMRYVEARYGEFVLLRPPINARTLLLWLAPLLILLAALGLVARGLLQRQAPAASAATLSAAEEAKLRGLLDEPHDKSGA
jgi:cytochrome c-type biogenesis protein CcmH